MTNIAVKRKNIYGYISEKIYLTVKCNLIVESAEKIRPMKHLLCGKLHIGTNKEQ